jgi:hypothetical protein
MDLFDIVMPGLFYLLPVPCGVGLAARGSGPVARGSGAVAPGSVPIVACDRWLINASGRGFITARDRGAIGTDQSGMTAPHA